MTILKKTSYFSEDYIENYVLLTLYVFVFVVSYIVWSVMKATIGIRLSKEGETKGTDVTETGVIAYAIRD